MTVTIAAAAWVLGLGLRMRNARARQQPRPKAWWRRHVRTGRIALAVGGVGLVLGPLAWVVLRGEALLSSLHGRVGLVTATLALGTFLLGRRMELGRGHPRDLHAAVGILTVLGAIVALLTGLELLP